MTWTLTRDGGVATLSHANPPRHTLTAAGVEHVLLFYTRLLRHELLRRFRGRLWNLHPSLLPAFPGLHPFEDAIMADARVLGTTIHAVDAGMDTGAVLLQSVFARRPDDTEVALRHALFEQQPALQTLFGCRGQGDAAVVGLHGPAGDESVSALSQGIKIGRAHV